MSKKDKHYRRQLLVNLRGDPSHILWSKAYASGIQFVIGADPPTVYSVMSAPRDILEKEVARCLEKGYISGKRHLKVASQTPSPSSSTRCWGEIKDKILGE